MFSRRNSSIQAVSLASLHRFIFTSPGFCLFWFIFLCIFFCVAEKYAQIQQNPVLPPASFLLGCKNSQEVSSGICRVSWSVPCTPPHVSSLCPAGTASQPATCSRSGKWWSTFTRRSLTWTTSPRPPAPRPTISLASRRRKRTWRCWRRRRSSSCVKTRHADLS